MLGIEDTQQISQTASTEVTPMEVSVADDNEIGNILNGSAQPKVAKHKYHHPTLKEAEHVIPRPNPVRVQEEKNAYCKFMDQNGKNCDGTLKEQPGIKEKLTKWFNDFIHQFDVLNKNTQCSYKLKIFLSSNERGQLNQLFNDSNFKNKMADIMVNAKKNKSLTCEDDAAKLIRDKSILDKIFKTIQDESKNKKYNELNNLLSNHEKEFKGFVQNGGLNDYFQEKK